MKFTGINHLAMATADMDTTVRFWRKTVKGKTKDTQVITPSWAAVPGEYDSKERLQAYGALGEKL